MKLIELKSTVSQRVLLESLDSTNRNSYYLWENVGQRISEAQLSTAQINALFGAVEQNATDSGSNRTIVGKGKDAYDAVSAAYSDLKDKIYNSGPMENFAAQYDKAADALKDKAGGDQGAVMQYVQKYRKFAEKHPIMQGVLYSALIAAAGISGAGLAGAGALALFKLTDQLIQGKDVRSALYTAGKTGAMAYGASKLGDLIKGGGDAAGDAAEIDFDQAANAGQSARLFGADVGTTVGDHTIGQDYVTALGKLKDGNLDLNNVIDATMTSQTSSADLKDIAKTAIDAFVEQNAENMGAAELQNAVSDFTNQVAAAQQEALKGLAKSGMQTDIGYQAFKAQGGRILDKIATDSMDAIGRGGVAFPSPEILPGSEMAKVVPELVGKPITDTALKSAADAVKNFADMSPAQAVEAGFIEAPGEYRNYLSTLSKEWKSAAAAVKQAAGESKVYRFDNAVNLTESDLITLFTAVAYKQPLVESQQLDELDILQKAKDAGAAVVGKAKELGGKAVAAGMQKAATVGKNITTKVTVDKLMKAWEKAGSPNNDEKVAEFLTGFGIDPRSVQAAFKTAGLEVPKDAPMDQVEVIVSQAKQNSKLKDAIIAYLEGPTKRTPDTGLGQQPQTATA